MVTRAAYRPERIAAMDEPSAADPADRSPLATVPVRAKIESSSLPQPTYPVETPTMSAPDGTGVPVDPELIARAQRGDEDAFTSLALAVGGRLHAVAYRILRDTAIAEDATQQALLAIWRDLPRLREPERFEAWCYRVVVRACHAEARRERQRPSRYLSPGDEPVAVEDYRLVVDRDELERGFRRLSIDHRAVVVLHHYLDMPVLDVARALGVPPGTVRSRLHHAMRSLRAALDADARVAPREAIS
jgi:RNA polymerase sigma-70 factor (ECF subfamily)